MLGFHCHLNNDGWKKSPLIMQWLPNTIRNSRRGGLGSLQKRVWEIYISHISRPLRDLRILFIPTHSLPHSRLHYGLYTNRLIRGLGYSYRAIGNSRN